MKISTWVLISFLSFSFSANYALASQCLELFFSQKNETTFPHTNVWALSASKYKTIADVNGLLIELVSLHFKEHGQLPTEAQLQSQFKERTSDSTLGDAAKHIINKGLASYFLDKKTSPSSIEHIFKQSLEVRKRFFKETYTSIYSQTALFALQRLRWPTASELAEVTQLSEQAISLFRSDQPEFRKKAWKVGQSIRTDEALEQTPAAKALITAHKQAEKALIDAFLRVIRQTDIETDSRTRPTLPTLSQLFEALAKTAPKKLLSDIESGLFTEQHLTHVVGMSLAAPNKTTSMDLAPVLFKGITQLEARAREKSPTAFKGYRSSTIVNDHNTERLIEAIETKRGFLLTSINGDTPLVNSLLKTMLMMAERRDYDIIIIPTLGVVDGIPPVLLNHPRIHIQTHIVTHQSLQLLDTVGPKMLNALSSLDGPRQNQPMQTTIIGSSQIMHKNIPTDTNHLRPTALWTTGSLSIPNYKSRSPVQRRTAEIAKNNHTNGFLVVEKADGQSGEMRDGTPGLWHVRPVYYKNDLDYNNRAGFTDLGEGYFVTRESPDITTYRKTETVIEQMPVDTIVKGDLHQRLANQQYMRDFLDYLASLPGLKRIVLHDALDAGTHNHHEAKNTTLMSNKLRTGELDIHAEITKLIQFVNALHKELPGIEVVIADSNHHYWGHRLVNGEATQLQQVVNARFLAEMRMANTKYEVNSDPLTYYFKYRNDELSTFPAHTKAEAMKDSVLVENPQLVTILPRGVPYHVGDYPHRQVAVNNHGHEGSNGAKGSPKTHAAGANRSVTGDSHQAFVLGNWMSAGVSTNKKVGFNDGGYGAWAHADVIIYSDGTKQLATYQLESQTYYNRADKFQSSAEEFFGPNRPKVEIDPDELPGSAILDQYSQRIHNPTQANEAQSKSAKKRDDENIFRAFFGNTQ